MNNISLGKYTPYNTLLHKLDPRTKILSMIFMMVTIFFTYGSTWTNLIVYVVIGIINFILMSSAKIKLGQLFKQLKMMWVMMIFLLIINIFTIKEELPIVIPGVGEFVSFTIPYINLTIYYSAFVNSFYIIFRLALMVSLTLILTSTTKPMDLTYGLEWLMTPLKVLHFPVHEVAMTISLALRFIPTLLDETDRIMKAQASRGVDFQEGSLGEKITQIVSLLVPMFVISFRRAEDLSNAMEARGYVIGAPRTKLDELKFKGLDFVCFVICFIFLGCAIGGHFIA